MQINSVNSPAFGCGACAQLKNISEKQVGRNFAKYYYNGIKLAIQTLEEEGLTHGQAASKILKNVKKSIKSRKIYGLA